MKGNGAIRVGREHTFGEKGQPSSWLERGQRFGSLLNLNCCAARRSREGLTTS